jgi:hypothetical protein
MRKCHPVADVQQAAQAQDRLAAAAGGVMVQDGLDNRVGETPKTE